MLAHPSSVNVSADVCESLSDNMNISVSPLQPLCSLILSTFCILFDLFLFDFLLPSSRHPSQPLTLWLLLPTNNFVSSILCCLFFSVLGTFFSPQCSRPPNFWSSSSDPLVHFILPCHLLKCLILLSALLLHLSPFLPLTTKLPLYSSSCRWRTPCSWTKPRSSLGQRRPVHPPSLTPPHHPPPHPITPRLCSPFLDQWRQGPGCVWSQNKKEVGLPQEAVVGATVAVHHWVWWEDTCTSHTPPRTSPLCLCPLRGSWLRVSRLFCPLSFWHHLTSSTISISLSRYVCSPKLRNTRQMLTCKYLHPQNRLLIS